MKKLMLTGAILAATLASGCTFIQSAQPTMATATGEIWYTKTTVVIIPVSKVVYCDGKTDLCKEAEIR